MTKHHPLDIEYAAADGTVWLWSKGHHPKAAFAVQAATWLTDDDRADLVDQVHETHIRHSYGRVFRDFIEDRAVMDFHCAKGRGAFPVTYIEMETPRCPA